MYFSLDSHLLDSPTISTIYPTETPLSLHDRGMDDLDLYSDIKADMTLKSFTNADSIDLVPLSPSLTGDGLDNWKLNEVFQDLMEIEKMDSKDVEDTTELIRNSKDLLAEAFSLTEQPLLSTECKVEPVTELELSELVPITVDDLHSQVSHLEYEPSTSQHSVVGEDKQLRKVSKKGKARVGKAKSSKPASKVPNNVVLVKPHETEKEAVRRIRNNAASRVFRSRKKSKLEDMLAAEEELRTHNEEMRADVAMVEEVVRMLKEGLVNSAKQLRNH